MYRSLICLLLAGSTLAATRGTPIALPDKYSAEKYADLKPYERQRCDRLVNELKLIEKRRQLGAIHSATKTDMDKRREQIDADYDRFCLNATVKPTLSQQILPQQQPN
jgi:hypothetical protein